MSFATMRSLRGTLALRLTIRYALIFALSSALAFGFTYGLLVSILHERTDGELEDDIEEYAAFLERGGMARIEAELLQETLDPNAGDSFYNLVAADGTRIADAGIAAPETAPPPELLPELAAGGEPHLATLRLAGQEARFRVIHGRIGEGLLMSIGISLEDNDELLATTRTGILAAMAAMALLGGPVGLFLARRALSGVGEVTRAAAEIAGGDLDRRVPVRSRGGEVELLAETFNGMLDRIQTLIRGMQEVTDSLAHDIRSPLARIRSSAEMLLVSEGVTAEQGALAAAVVEDCDRLIEMADVTLDIVEAESGATRLNLGELDLGALAREACDLFGTLAEDKGIALVGERLEGRVVRGDRHRLQRVVANLLDNAIKYTPVGGRIDLSLTGVGDCVRLEIADSGLGIAPDEQPRVFERFYRCDASRSDRGGGLGLSLALAFARAHGGTIELVSEPGRGSAFTLVLPAAEIRS